MAEHTDVAASTPDPNASFDQTPGASERQLAWFEWMDFCRTAAALLVVTSHARDIVMSDYAGQKLYAPIYAATKFGHSGVIVFFVLSGFWISRSVLRRIDQPDFWKTYAIDRLSRLWIVLLPALLIGGLLDWIGAVHLALPLYAGTSGSHSITAPVVDWLGFGTFLGNVIFLQTIVVHQWGSNGPLWSLASEFWYYVWFPALALLFFRRRPTFALAGLAIMAISPTIGLGFLSWLVGFVLLLAVPPGVSARNRGWLAAGSFGLFSIILLLSGAISFWALDLLLAICFALLLYSLLRCGIALPRLLRPAARYGQSSSYSLYVIHFPVMALVGSIATHGQRLQPSPYSIAVVLGLTVLCVVGAWAFSLFTERNTDRARGALRRAMASRLTSGG